MSPLDIVLDPIKVPGVLAAKLWVKEGSKDDEIYEFLTDRYGDFILLKPPFNLKTLFLWLLPIIFLILLAGGWITF